MVFIKILSKRRITHGKRVTETSAEITMPFMSTMPMSKPMEKDMNNSAKSPAMVVKELAETGLMHSAMESLIARFGSGCVSLFL